MRVGIDFGTTNSAVAVVGEDGAPRMLQLAPNENTQRTVIFSDGRQILFGNAAFTGYLDNDLQGRFLRSLKAFLPDEVPRTTLGNRRFDFTEIVGSYLRYLVDGAERVLGQAVTGLTIGRPVRFHKDPGKHQRALDQLEEAITRSKLPPHTLQLEPIAAALRYEAGLTSDKTVLVGDFGGGTADFAVLRVGPSRRAAGKRDQDVLATAGVAQAGDALDGRFVNAFLLEFFGMNAPFNDRKDQIQLWRPSILDHIPRLYDIHRHRDRELTEYLDRMEPRMVDPRVVRRLRRLVFDDLGYPMAQAIEASKRALSFADDTTFRFDEFYSDALDLRREISGVEFAAACQAILSAYEEAIEAVLAQSGLAPEGIDEVFLTGGTSQIPFIRDLFVARFGADKLRSADAFTSVCEGLALS